MSSRTKRPYSLGVDWHLPDGKGGFRHRRYTTTTKATSDLIEALAGDGHTVYSARDAVIYDNEAKTVLDGLIDAGVGQHRLDRYVRSVTA